MVTSAIRTEETEELEPYPYEEIELIEDDSQAPDTDDIEELRRYWDTHVATEYNSELVPAEELPAKLTVDVTFAVRVERANIYKILDLSKAEGIGSVRMAEKLLNRAISEAHRAANGGD